MGIDHFNDLYVDDEDFTDIYKVCWTGAYKPI